MREIKFRAWCKKYGDRQYTEWCKAKALRDIWGLNHDQRVDLYQRETGNTYTPVEYWEMDYDPHANDEWASETQPLNPVIDTIVREGDFLMQYTGLEDKNGVEIYESDIVQWSGDEGVAYDYEVEWIDGGWFADGQWLSDINEVVSVIGNKYEIR